MPRIPAFQVDAFTDRRFGGNAAAVCWLEQPADPEWMQSVAAELNLPATAFVTRVADELHLRWFTPLVEAALCGHATLATAHALWTEGLVPHERPLNLQTRSGTLTCRPAGEWIELDFPHTPASEVEPPIGLFEALGRTGCWVGRSRLDLLVVYDSPAEVRQLAPNFPMLRLFDTRGVIVTSRSDLEGVDFLSRFFAPAVGVDEDPVCGSAHCCLAPFWAERLGRSELVARQVSRREGVLRLRCEGDRVVLAGQAVTVWRGELLA